MIGIPRLRIFAGPNGSGKSTIKSVVPNRILGFYLNPDEIEKEIRQKGILNAKDFNIQTTQADLQQFFVQHPLIHKTELSNNSNLIKWKNNQFISFENIGIDSYISAILTDFLRQKYLEVNASFTFETVMSSSDKIEIFKKAQNLGYRTYLYYGATEEPMINLLRINHRVRMGGIQCQKIK